MVLLIVVLFRFMKQELHMRDRCPVHTKRRFDLVGLLLIVRCHGVICDEECVFVCAGNRANQTNHRTHQQHALLRNTADDGRQDTCNRVDDHQSQ